MLFLALALGGVWYAARAGGLDPPPRAPPAGWSATQAENDLGRDDATRRSRPSDPDAAAERSAFREDGASLVLDLSGCQTQGTLYLILSDGRRVNAYRHGNKARFEAPPGDAKVRFYETSWGERVVRTRLGPGENLLAITARGDPREYPIPWRRGRIEVVVLDAVGVPIEGAPVRVERRDSVQTWDERTGADGRCRLHPTPGELTLRVGDLTAPVTACAGTETRFVARPEQLGEVRLGFHEPPPMLVRADGTNLDSGRYRVAAPDGWRFVFVAAGIYTVRAVDGRPIGEVRIRSGAASDLDHALPDAHLIVHVDIHVREGALDVPKTAVLRLRGLTGGAAFLDEPSEPVSPREADDRSLVFRVTCLPPGRYEVRVTALGGVHSAQCTAELEAAATAEVAVRLE